MKLLQKQSGIEVNLKKKLNLENGFTIIELVIVSIVVLLLTASFLPFFKTNVQAYLKVRGGKSLVQKTRVCLTKMSAQISRIQDSGDIIYATGSRFYFYDPTGNDVRYRLSGDELQDDGDQILDKVNGVSFIYYDNAGNVTTTKNRIYRIRISITVDAGEVGSMTFHTQVFPRNFGNFN